MNNMWKQIDNEFIDLFLNESTKMFKIQKLKALLDGRSTPLMKSMTIERLDRQERIFIQSFIRAPFFDQLMEHQLKRAKSLFEILTTINKDIDSELKDFKNYEFESYEQVMDALNSPEKFMALFVHKQFLEVPYHTKNTKLNDYQESLFSQKIPLTAEASIKNYDNYIYLMDKINAQDGVEINKLRSSFDKWLKNTAVNYEVMNSQSLINTEKFLENCLKTHRMKHKLKSNLSIRFMEKINKLSVDELDKFFPKIKSKVDENNFFQDIDNLLCLLKSSRSGIKVLEKNKKKLFHFLMNNFDTEKVFNLCVKVSNNGVSEINHIFFDKDKFFNEIFVKYPQLDSLYDLKNLEEAEALKKSMFFNNLYLDFEKFKHSKEIQKMRKQLEEGQNIFEISNEETKIIRFNVEKINQMLHYDKKDNRFFDNLETYNSSSLNFLTKKRDYYNIEIIGVQLTFEGCSQVNSNEFILGLIDLVNAKNDINELKDAIPSFINEIRLNIKMDKAMKENAISKLNTPEDILNNNSVDIEQDGSANDNEGVVIRKRYIRKKV